ncbi:MAG: hypothetical protein AB7O26_17905 [Planctomycetaceae bacterium]
MFLDQVRNAWNRLRGIDPRDQPTIAGIFGHSRGGTNLIAATLHYHPQIFSVTEHDIDHRVPLERYWKARSVFRIDGRQEKYIRQIRCVTFNKVQRDETLWGAGREYPAGTRFIFYLRNPLRVQSSREAYRRKRAPQRFDWADTDQNFTALLSEARGFIDAYQALKNRYPCLILTHEYYCCDYDEVLPHIHEFLGVASIPPSDPLKFFQECGRCGRPFGRMEEMGQTWIACPKHRNRVKGCGSFNPLRAVEQEGVLDTMWKDTPNAASRLQQVADVLGQEIAAYYLNGDYTRNIPIDTQASDVQPARCTKEFSAEDAEFAET